MFFNAATAKRSVAICKRTDSVHAAKSVGSLISAVQFSPLAWDWQYAGCELQQIAYTG